MHLKEDEELKKLGKEIIVNQFKNQKIRFSDETIKTILVNFNLKDSDDLFLKIGNGDLVSSKIILSTYSFSFFIKSSGLVIKRT